MSEEKIDTTGWSAEQFEEQLESEDMPANQKPTAFWLRKQGYDVRSYEKLQAETLRLQEGIDKEIVHENNCPSADSLSKLGLRPCQRVARGEYEGR